MSTTLRLPPKVRLDLTAKQPTTADQHTRGCAPVRTQVVTQQEAADPAPVKANAKPAKKTKPGRIPPKVHNAEQQQRKQAEVQERTQREMAEANERRAAARAANLDTLAERFPAVFNADKPLPLAIRADKAVREALALPWSQGNDLLHWWTHRPAYYQALIAGGARHDLDGTENGVVTPHQQAHATKALRRHQNWLARTTAQAGETKEGASTV
jgi:hypothetical protein